MSVSHLTFLYFDEELHFVLMEMPFLFFIMTYSSNVSLSRVGFLFVTNITLRATIIAALSRLHTLLIYEEVYYRLKSLTNSQPNLLCAENSSGRKVRNI